MDKKQTDLWKIISNLNLSVQNVSAKRGWMVEFFMRESQESIQFILAF